MFGVIVILRCLRRGAARVAKEGKTLSEKRSSAKISFTEKALAWWNGYDIRVKKEHKRVKRQGRVLTEREKRAARLEVLNDLWGEGYSSPGERQYIMELLKPFGLNASMSVADVGSGLGGAARVMAEEFGVWVNAMEADATLAERGMDLSRRAGLGRKAPIKSFDPVSHQFKKGSFDCVFSKEMLYSYKGRNLLMAGFFNSLKPQGQALFTDFVLSGNKDEDASQVVESWNNNEPHECDLWRVGEYVESMTKNGMDVRITEDISEKYIDLVQGRWAEFAEHMENKQIPEHMGEIILKEVEMWAERVRLLKGGEIRLYRFFGLRF